jgi:hypothetical protein
MKKKNMKDTKKEKRVSVTIYRKIVRDTERSDRLFFAIHFPVEPNPPVPRFEGDRSPASTGSARQTGAITSWAIRSPFCTVKSPSPKLTRMISSSPR